jgi:hypothetical protein
VILSGLIALTSFPIIRRRRSRPFVAAFLSLLCIGSEPKPVRAAVEIPYHKLVEFCRGVGKPLFLAADRSFICFDGQILEDRDYSHIDSLNAGGAFVVRSQGGNAIAAMTIAAVLEQKQAVVIVYDYCLSACASYLLIAANKAYVVKDSIVAWHDWTTGELDCPDIVKVKTPYGDQWQLVRSLCTKNAAVDLTKYRQAEAMEKDFYSRRTFKDQISGTPQSVYVRRSLLRVYEATGKFPEILWMWNPRYHKAALKTQVIYEAYPETQEEVDVLAQRLGIGRQILHDP